MPKQYKLNFQLVPDGCWYTNLRSALPKEVWDRLRRAAYARAGGRCSICGKPGRLEAHEVWSYDDKKHIQKLKNIIAVCPACHEVIHIGRTSLLGNEPRAGTFHARQRLHAERIPRSSRRSKPRACRTQPSRMGDRYFQAERTAVNFVVCRPVWSANVRHVI